MPLNLNWKSRSENYLRNMSVAGTAFGPYSANELHLVSVATFPFLKITVQYMQHLPLRYNANRWALKGCYFSTTESESGRNLYLLPLVLEPPTRGFRSYHRDALLYALQGVSRHGVYLTRYCDAVGKPSGWHDGGCCTIRAIRTQKERVPN